MASALPTISKSYYFNWNQQVSFQTDVTTTGKKVALLAKQNFTGQASGFVDASGASVSPTNMWVSKGSSNGVTAGIDNVDRWATTADIVPNTEGNAHSWWIGQNDALGPGFQMMLVANFTSMDNLTVVISPSAGFTGGSTTARPTATDEYVNCAGSWDNGSSFSGGCILDFMQSTDGKICRLFGLVFVSDSTAARVALGFRFETVANPTVGWALPVVWLRNDGVSLNNSSYFGPATWVGLFGSTYALLEQTTEGNPYNGIAVNRASLTGSPAGINQIDSTYLISPVGIQSSLTAGTYGYHGNLVDAWFGEIGLTNNSGAFAKAACCYPLPGARQFIQFGASVFPSPDIVPIVKIFGGVDTATARVDGRVTRQSAAAIIPTLSNFVPASPARLLPNQAVQFDVTPAVLVKIYASFPGGGVNELVHDGYNFKPYYLGSTNTTAVVGGVMRYTVLRDGGWLLPPTFEIDPGVIIA